jgi:hypothetical protein
VNLRHGFTDKQTTTNQLTEFRAVAKASAEPCKGFLSSQPGPTLEKESQHFDQ